MKIKALWGWVGAKGAVRTGEIIEVDEEYGHQMIGKGLAVEATAKEVAEAAKAKPTENKQAAPEEKK